MQVEFEWMIFVQRQSASLNREETSNRPQIQGPIRHSHCALFCRLFEYFIVTYFDLIDLLSRFADQTCLSLAPQHS